MTDDGIQRSERRIGWRHIGIAAYIGVNLALIIYQTWAAFDHDWDFWRRVGEVARPYDVNESGLQYVWSPLMLPVISLATAAPWAWALMHFAAVAAVRDWLFGVLMLCSFGFWSDLAGGNTLTFSVVAGVLAWRGNQPSALVYLALVYLMPRPVQLPLAFMLLMRMPELRVPAAALFIAHAILVGGDQGAAWVQNMVQYAQTTPFDLGPRTLLGAIWLPIGLAIALWLTWRRRPGWAGLFASPYGLPQYFLMPLIEVRARPPIPKPTPAD